MTDRHEQQPKQTTPKGVEIPVPKREDFLRDLKKVAPAPAKGSTTADIGHVADKDNSA